MKRKKRVMKVTVTTIDIKEDLEKISKKQ